jgi:hypothetical protein
MLQIYRCYRSDPSLLTDLVRCQVVFGNLKDMKTFIEVRRYGSSGLDFDLFYFNILLNYLARAHVTRIFQAHGLNRTFVSYSSHSI